MVVLKPFSAGLIIFVCLFTAACMVRSKKPKAPDLNYSASFNGVTFKSGRPNVGDSLEEVVSGADQIYWLRADIEVKNIPDGVLRVDGFTDGIECSGVACDQLSLRRAQLVYDWLVAHGVPKRQLKSPRGRGNTLQLNDNSTEERRQVNRRTEVDLVL